MSMHQHPAIHLSPQQSEQDYQSKILQYLENIPTSTATSNSTSKSTMQEQLKMMSVSYKNAQEKLLSLEKQLYFESIYNEKQRSIIELFKHLFQGNIDDDTILTYIASIQDQTVDSPLCGHFSESELKKNQYNALVKQELTQLKQILMNRKKGNKQSQSKKDALIDELRKELKACNKVKRELMQDMDGLLNQKEDIADKLELSKKSFEEMKNQCEIAEKACSEMMTRQLAAEQQHQRIMKEKEQEIQDYSNKLRSMEEQAQFLNKQQIHTLSKIHKFLSRNEPTSQQESEVIKLLPADDKQEPHKAIQRAIVKLCSKLSKYHTITKQLSHKILNGEQSKLLITTLKGFLSDESTYRIVQQLEAILASQSSENTYQYQCLIRELESCSRLNTKRVMQLENCEQELSELKMRVLREEHKWNRGDYGSCTDRNIRSLSNTQRIKSNRDFAQSTPHSMRMVRKASRFLETQIGSLKEQEQSSIDSRLDKISLQKQIMQSDNKQNIERSSN